MQQPQTIYSRVEVCLLPIERQTGSQADSRDIKPLGVLQWEVFVHVHTLSLPEAAFVSELASAACRCWILSLGCLCKLEFCCFLSPFSPVHPAHSLKFTHWSQMRLNFTSNFLKLCLT